MMISIKRIYRNLRRMLRSFRYQLQYLRQEKEAFLNVLNISDEYQLFITNDNFGGTRQYEDNVTKLSPKTVILRRLSYGERSDIIYEVSNLDKGKNFLLSLSDLNEIFRLHFSQITINTLVHTTTIENIFNHVIEYKINHPNCRLLYLVHDFHSVCLNCNLYVNDHYCALKCEEEKCNLYLADKKVTIQEWRMIWKRFFAYVDEIRCFSNSSKEILCQAYKDLEKNKIKIQPHDLSFITFTPIIGIERLSLHLGIIGACNANIKGKSVAKKIIRKYGDEFPISMVGSSYRYYKIKKKKVKYMGLYQQGELQNIIEHEKISLAIVPSLCPETFSYLISELIAMDIPIACFNYGAQAEKVRKYYKGIVCNNVEEMCDYIESQR